MWSFKIVHSPGNGIVIDARKETWCKLEEEVHYLLTWHSASRMGLPWCGQLCECCTFTLGQSAAGSWVGSSGPLYWQNDGRALSRQQFPCSRPTHVALHQHFESVPNNGSRQSEERQLRTRTVARLISLLWIFDLVHIQWFPLVNMLRIFPFKNVLQAASYL